MTLSERPSFRFSHRPNRAHEIAWEPWSDAAFARARERDRPVLLSLSATWCHWCHVMDETTYSDPEVIERLNRDYVAIRVDADERPDVNGRYNVGGWPSTVFLTAEGEIIAGATYIPPDEMRTLLANVGTYVREERDDIAERVARAREERAAAAVPSPGMLQHDITDAVVDEVAGFFDERYGGFGVEPKFPQIESLELMLLAHRRTGRAEPLGMVRRSIEAMMGGDLWDDVGGGYYRYATRRDWTDPHYEKLIEDQAGHLRLLLALLRLTGDDRYAERARAVIAYIDAALWDGESGAFLGSQEADPEYVALSAESRALRESPFVDRTVYAAWSARAAAAYLEASWTLGAPELADRARRAIDLISARMRSADGLVFRVMPLPDSPPSTPGLLTDHVELAHAALDAYQTLGSSSYRDLALELARLLRERFQDGAGGAFLDIAHGADGPGRLRERQRNLAENARAALLFVRLHALTRDREHLGPARAALTPFVGTFAQHTNFASGYAMAVDALLHEPIVINVVIGRDRAAASALHDAALRVDEPFRAVQLLDDEGAGSLDLPTVSTSAYVCVGAACSAPLADPSAIEPTVRAMLDAVGAGHRH